MRNPLRVRFVRDVALLGGTQSAQAAAAMIAGILVARILGPEGRGTISVLVALGSMAVLLTSFGVHTSGIYFLGRFKAERDVVVANSVLFGAVGGIVTAALLSVVVLAFHAQLLRGISLGLFFLYLTVVPFNYFNEFARRIGLGLGRLGMFNVPEVIGGGGLLLGTVAALATFGNHLAALVTLRVLIEVATALVLIVMLRRVIEFRFRPSATMLRKQVNYGVRNYASSLMWVFLLQSDLVLVNHFLGPGSAGVYSVAVSLGLPVTLLAGAVGALTFQRVSSEEDRAARIKSTNRILRLLAPLVLICMLGMLALSEPIVRVVYGHDFVDAALALILLLPGLWALTLETVIMNFLAGEGSPPIVFLAPASGLAINFLGNLYAIPHWGINGASLTSSLGYIVVFAIVLGYYVRSTGSRTRDVLRTDREDLRALWRASEAPAANAKANG